METIQNIDTQLFCFLNGMHCDYCDSFMWLLSGKFSSALLVIMLLFLLYQKGWKQMAYAIVGIALVILLADQLASGIIKPLVERLRPTHDPSLMNIVHTVNGYTGGQYGFASSHAANMFAVAAFASLLFKNRWVWLSMLIWAALVSYSRIYLGVHYPGDVLAGAIIGLVMAVLVNWGGKKLQKRYPKVLQPEFNKKDACFISASMVASLLVIAIVAIFY